jgi:Tol biopolymer transport system component
MIGRVLSHYRILEKLGAGGMGEVYRARDEKLGRDVAVKVLPAGLLGSEVARARFRKEAEALSRLSHPHIATLLDFDSEDGTDFLVMELVEGKTLLEAVREGPLSEKEVVRLGSQLARGLQAAHEHGVIHRDLKPGNLALTSDGLLKVLDFGLARLGRLTLPEVGEKTASTDTAVGHVVGTPSYMAPEQLRGKGVDARTDVYGAGACLYELATGRRPFGTKSGVELTDAVLHEAPVAPRSVGGTVSVGLESVILKCLDKDPGLRYQTAKELLVDLERLQVATTSGAASQPVAVVKSGRRWPWLLAAAAILAIGGGAWLLWPPPPPRITVVRPLTGDLRFPPGGVPGIPSWATDGQRVYYLAGKGAELALFQVPVNGGEPVEIPLAFPVERGIFSYVPSESALLMRGARERVVEDASLDSGPPLWLVQVPAGTPRRIGNLTGSWADASPDGRQLVIARGSRLLVASIDGSSERELRDLRPLWPSWPRWAPDGRHIRFNLLESGARDTSIWETSTDGEAPRRLWRGASGDWTADGRQFVLWRANDLFSVRERRWPWESSEPVRLTVGPLIYARPEPSPDGRHLFTLGTTPRGEVMKLDGATKRFLPALGGESAFYAEPSPDARWLAWVRYPDGTLWRSRPDGSERLQLTGAPMEAHLPRWSPDGQRIVFVARTADDPQLVVRVVSADASAAELVARPEKPELDYWDPCWLPDGSILFNHLQYTAPAGILRFDPGTRRVERLPGAESYRGPKCSPDGSLLAVDFERGQSRFVLRRAGMTSWENVDIPAAELLQYPSWRRDGRSFCGLSSRDGAVKCYSLADRRLETLASTQGLPLAVWVSVSWMGLDADGLPFVTADRSTRALYSLDLEAP